MSYDIFITTQDVDGVRVDVPISSSQFGSLSPLYAAAIPGIDSMADLDARSCREIRPDLAAGLIDLTVDPEKYSKLAGHNEEVLETFTRTLQGLLRETTRRPSGYVRCCQ